MCMYGVCVFFTRRRIIILRRLHLRGHRCRRASRCISAVSAADMLAMPPHTPYIPTALRNCTYIHTYIHTHTCRAKVLDAPARPSALAVALAPLSMSRLRPPPASADTPWWPASAVPHIGCCTPACPPCLAGTPPTTRRPPSAHLLVRRPSDRPILPWPALLRATAAALGLAVVVVSSLPSQRVRSGSCDAALGCSGSLTRWQHGHVAASTLLWHWHWLPLWPPLWHWPP